MHARTLGIPRRLSVTSIFTNRISLPHTHVVSTRRSGRGCRSAISRCKSAGFVRAGASRTQEHHQAGHRGSSGNPPEAFHLEAAMRQPRLHRHGVSDAESHPTAKRSERKAEGQHLYVQGSLAHAAEVLAEVLEHIDPQLVVPTPAMWEKPAGKRPTMPEDELTDADRERQEDDAKEDAEENATTATTAEAKK